MAKEPNSSVNLSVDGNICCISAKKRAENCGKSKKTIWKKFKLNSVNSKSISPQPTALEKMPSTSNAERSFTWATDTIEDQDEVICTPDIIPIDDSPPSSPKAQSAPVVPLTVQPNVQLITQAHVATMPPLRPTAPTSIQMAEFQKQLQTAFPQKIFLTQASQMSPKLMNSNPVIIKPGVGNSATGNILTLNDNKYKFVISNPLNKPVQNLNTNYILKPVTSGNSISNTAMVQPPVQIPNKPVQEPDNKSDWFDQAVVHCAEVTEYITTKISSLSGVHTRAYKSKKLMEEIHNTLQTYLYVAIEKLHKVKKTMKDNFENERTKKVKFVNTNSKRKRDKGSDESSFHCTSMSEVSDSDSNYLERPKKRRRRKSSKCRIEMICPEDVPFDMTVTNASDEEQSMNGESRPDSPNDVELVGEIKTKGVSNEIISLLETTDDEEDDGGGGDNAEEENRNEFKSGGCIVKELANKLKSKINVGDVEGTELLKHLSAVVSVENEVQDRLENNEKCPEKSNDESSVDKDSELSHIETTNKSPKISPEKSNDTKIEETLVEDIDKQNDEPNVSQDDDGEKLLDNVDEKKNEEEIQASNTSDKSDEENLEKEEALENNRENLTNNVEKKEDSKTNNEVEFDVEEMLNSAVVPKSNINASNSFGDVFSKFINREETHAIESGKPSSNEKSIIDENEKIDSDVSSEKISESITSSESYPDISSDMEDVDNSSLSLPPDGLMEYYKDASRKNNTNINNHDNNATDKPIVEIENIKDSDENVGNKVFQDGIKNNCKNKIVKNSDKNSSSSVKRAKKVKGKNKKSNPDQSVIEENSDKTDNSEVILDSEIMALKQMAENCVGSSVDVRKASAECKV